MLVAPFGRQAARFYHLEGDGERLLAETVLANDGATPNAGNLEVEQLGVGQWQVTLKGQEQADEIWILAISDGSPEMERRSSGSEP